MQTRLFRLIQLGTPAISLLLGTACSSESNTPSGVGSRGAGTDDTAEDDGSGDDSPTASVDAGSRRDASVDASSPVKSSGDAGVDATPTAVDAGQASEPTPTDGGKPPVSSGGSCLDGITDYGPTGPFKYSAKPSGSIKMWIPEVPAGCKVPVVHLANGTGATCGAYQNVLNTLASHGFLTTCYESTQTGAGTQGLMAFKTAVEMYPDLADKRFGSTGHSQGGQAAFTVLQLTEAEFGDSAIYAGLAMEPASGFGSQPSGGSWQSVYAKIKSPMFMFSGTADTLVSASWVARAFAALSDDIEAYNWSASGATHIPTPQGETQQISVPWFRWKLLGDKEACKAFKALPGAGRWREVSAQNAANCE